MEVACRTTLYENLFILRVAIAFNETQVTVERQGEQELLTWGPHCSSPDFSLAVESCAA